MNFAHAKGPYVKDQDGRPLPVNVHIGRKIKEARTSAGLSQQALADRIGGGLSAQQVKKYEKAEDRVAVSTLIDVAKATGRPISWFFEGALELGSMP